MDEATRMRGRTEYIGESKLYFKNQILSDIRELKLTLRHAGAKLNIHNIYY